MTNPINILIVDDHPFIIQAYKNAPHRALQDKADIQFIISQVSDLNWDKIKSYADLFNEWEVICEIKNNSKLR